MKQFISLLLAGLFLMAGQALHAQDNSKLVLLNISNLGTDKAAIRATRDFWSRVGESKEERWYRFENGLIAEYTEGPVSAKYQYDLQGRPVFSILTYSEWQLPTEVRQLVRSNYYDYKIGWVKEVSQGQDMAYVVHLDDSLTWKEIAVQNGEIRVLKEYRKQ